jgi:PAS domain-containing protein
MVEVLGESVVGRRCYEVSHGRNGPCSGNGHDCAVRRTFETGAAHTASHLHVDRDGKRHDVELKSYPIADATGAVVSAIETVNDVTSARHD